LTQETRAGFLLYKFPQGVGLLMYSAFISTAVLLSLQ